MSGARQILPDIVGTALLIGIGAAFAVGGAGYGIFGEEGRIGPGFMPFMTGVLVALFGVMVGLGAFRKARRTEDDTPERYEVPSDGEVEEAPKKTVAVVFAMTLAAILLTTLVGFLPAFGLLVFALVRFVEKGSILAAASLGVGSAAGAWLVFVLFLGIPLPVGVFGP